MWAGKDRLLSTVFKEAYIQQCTPFIWDNKDNIQGVNTHVGSILGTTGQFSVSVALLKGSFFVNRCYKIRHANNMHHGPLHFCCVSWWRRIQSLRRLKKDWEWLQASETNSKYMFCGRSEIRGLANILLNGTAILIFTDFKQFGSLLKKYLAIIINKNFSEIIKKLKNQFSMESLQDGWSEDMYQDEAVARTSLSNYRDT